MDFSGMYCTVVTKLNFATTASTRSRLNSITNPRMTLTVMSDDDAAAAVTVRSKRTIIPSSRLLDSNNSATPELTSHKQVQWPVQPNTAPMTNPCNAKRNADDAGWSSSLSNQDKDLDNEDANKSVYKGKYYQSLCRYAHYFIFIAKRLHRA